MCVEACSSEHAPFLSPCLSLPASLNLKSRLFHSILSYEKVGMTMQYCMINYGNNKEMKYATRNKLSKMFNWLSPAKPLATLKIESGLTLNIWCWSLVSFKSFYGIFYRKPILPKHINSFSFWENWTECPNKVLR